MSDGPGPTLTKIPGSAHVYFCFDLILYIPFNNFSVISGRVFLGKNSTKQRVMSFAQGHNALNAFVPVRPKLESLGLESSTLAQSHCASGFSLQLSIYIWLTVLLYVLNKKKESFHWMFFRQYACTRMPLSFMSPNMKVWRSRSQLKEALNCISTSYLFYAWFFFKFNFGQLFSSIRWCSESLI